MTEVQPANNRSAVTNGQRFLPRGVHSASTWARIARDVLAALYAHLGGESEVTETQRLLIRRVATLEAELVSFEMKFALAREKGDEPAAVDVELYGRLSDRQRRLAEPLGWKRAARDITRPHSKPTPTRSGEPWHDRTSRPPTPPPAPRINRPRRRRHTRRQRGQGGGMSATRHRLIALLDRYEDRVARLNLPPEGLVLVRRWLADARESALHCDETAMQLALRRIDNACFPRQGSEAER